MRARQRQRRRGPGFVGAGAIACAVAACLCLSSCTEVGAATAWQKAGVVRVVAAEDMWGDIAAQLGGAHASVISLVDSPNADPHLFEANAADAAVVAMAAIVVYNGANYDDWMPELLAAGASGRRQVLEVSTVLGRTGHVNPHLWYATARLHEVGAAIESALARADPAEASYYARRLSSFDRSLRPLLRLVRRIRDGFGGTKVAFTEPVPGYLLSESGLVSATPMGFAVAVENGVEPSPSDTEAFDSLVSARRIAVLIYNSQTMSSATSRLVALARASKVPVVAMSETVPAHRSFQGWQASQDQELLRALHQERVLRGASRPGRAFPGGGRGG